MKNTNTLMKLMAVSFIAMAAVSTAHAKIVSETMLGEGYSSSNTVKSDIGSRELESNKVTKDGVSSGQTLTAEEKESTTLYPSMVTAKKIAADEVAGANSNVTSIKNKIGLTGNNFTTMTTTATTLTGAINELDSEKVDKTVAADKNGIIVRNSAGLAMKGTGSDITVSDAGEITVNEAAHAATATTATTATTANGVAWSNVTDKPSTFTPSDHASNKVTAMTSYTKPSSAPTTAAIEATDSLNTAIGKLEYKLDNVKSTSDSAVQSVALASGTNNGTVKLTVNGTATDNIAVKGLGSAAYKDITDTYSGTSSDAMSGKAVKGAIDALDVSTSGGSGKFVSSVTQTDGKISVTKSTIEESDVTNLTSDLAAKQDNLGGTKGMLVVTTDAAGTVAYTPAVPTTAPATPSVDGQYVLTAKVVSGTPTFYWEDIGR